MPFLETFLAGLAVRGVYDATKGGAEIAYKKLKEEKPNIVEALSDDSVLDNDENRNKYIKSIMEFLSGYGIIDIDGAEINSLSNTTFNHETGEINISGTIVNAKSIITGGGNGSTGKTTIKENSQFNTNGTSIKVGTGCSIKISGNAQIRQS